MRITNCVLEYFGGRGKFDCWLGAEADTGRMCSSKSGAYGHRELNGNGFYAGIIC